MLLILAVLWGIVLGPWAWRLRTERRRMRSVDNFRRRLQVLAPVSETPRATRPSVAARPAGANRPAVALAASPSAPFAATPRSASTPASRRPAESPVRLSRAMLLRRRRRVLALLVWATVVTLAGGAIPALRVLWAANLVVDVALIGYVAVLRRLRRLAVERARKVRYLPAPAAAGVAEAVAVQIADGDGSLRHSASS